jgi:hypothetical protein
LTYIVNGGSGLTQIILTQGVDTDIFASSPLNESDADSETLTIDGVEVKRASFNLGFDGESSGSSSESVATVGPGGADPGTDPTVPSDVEPSPDDDGTGSRDVWYGWTLGNTQLMLHAMIDHSDSELVTDAEIEALIAAFIAVAK